MTIKSEKRNLYEEFLGITANGLLERSLIKEASKQTIEAAPKPTK